MTSPFIPTQLKLMRPVPSDIDIAQAAEIKPIAQVAEEIGILPDELEFGYRLYRWWITQIHIFVAYFSTLPPRTWLKYA